MGSYDSGRAPDFGGISIEARRGDSLNGIRFDSNRSDPSSANDVILYRGAGASLRFWDGSTATTLGSAGAVANFTLDDAYDDGRTITADSGAVTINSSGSGGGLALTDTGTGARLTFSGAGTGNDVTGTGSNWQVTNAGVGTFAGLVLGDDENITFGASSDATIDWEGANNVLNIAGAVDFDDNVTLAASATITQAGVAGSTVFTITAGDAVLSDGSLAITDADNAETVTIINNTANTIGAAASAGVVEIESTSLTTGTLLNLQLTEGTLNGGSYLRAWDATGGAAVFTVAEDGATTIAGAGGNNALTLTAGDAVLSDGSLTITDADNASSLVLNNDTATSADIVAIASGSLTTGSLVHLTADTAVPITTGRILEMTADTATTAAGLVELTADALTTGIGVLVTSTSDALAAGQLLNVDHTSSALTAAKTGQLVDIVSSRTQTAAATISDNYDAVSVIRTSVNTNAGGTLNAAGAVLFIQNVATQTAGTLSDTVNGIEIDMDGDGTGDAIDITHAATAGRGLDVNVAVTTVPGVDIDGTGAQANNVGLLDVASSGATAAGGSVLRVTNTGTPAAATSYLVDFDYSGATMTNNPVGVYINGGSSTESALEVVNSGATGNNIGVVDIAHSGATAAGGASLRVANTGTPAAATSYLADFDYSGATMTNNPVGIHVDHGSSTAAALQITGSGAAAANDGLLSLLNTGTGATGVVLHTQHTSTGSAAASDAVFQGRFEGLDAGDAVTEYGRLEVEILTATAGQEDGQFVFSTAMNNGTLTEAVRFGPRAGTATAEVQIGDGSGAAFLTSNGSFDLTIDTNNGSANEPSIVLTDGATGNITLTAGGTSGEIDLASPVLHSSTQAITGAGAISLTTSITELDTTGGGAYTLADGVEGQLKFVVFVLDSGTNATITPTNLAGGTTLTFSNVGESALLLFTNANWTVVATNGGVIA